MITFAGIEEKHTLYKTAAILLQSIPYDGTSTWGKGSDAGFDAFLEASRNMELYDIETDSEVYQHGIHILPPITESSSPEAMCQRVYEQTGNLLKTGKFPTFFGGEHSVSIGIIKAFYEKYPDITIVQLDAHADLRRDYMGTPRNHACAMHDANEKAKLIQVGIRSMDISEKEYIKKDQCYFAQDIAANNDWMGEALGQMSDKIYISIDMDVFDPSIMPSTGTPEPGGLDWYTVLAFLKMIFMKKQVMGFDLVELAPIPGNPAPDFLVAKLYYKMLSYKFKYAEI